MLAIIINGKVISTPLIVVKIAAGMLQIDNLTTSEANDLARKLNPPEKIPEPLTLSATSVSTTKRDN